MHVSPQTAAKFEQMFASWWVTTTMTITLPSPPKKVLIRYPQTSKLFLFSIS